MDVVQNGQMYYVYLLPYRILICQVLMPPDRQVLQDMMALKAITGGLDKRYNPTIPKKR